ncbi:glycolate oxidase subunit GlcF [Alkalilimnicola sp. S0819]|uniref:glycolate oxidase subunit GlcF n=1 Tax=Alkalilimnicola sp. S0819 TaxID=2613922 RepID=UPI0012627A65|nr:glycolate oxidase subunit GlcF [Alkalilimnicola sp. S0819]KAB7619752.1 glycolate oxidase subunit GlcF [Alkalilimnicola sp. S0819]MPQ17516.1 glycolate oxidase subunit GlcF [Alkalilimnicola sp. S0819]
MQTELADFLKDTPQGEEAERILRNCVHCGFCLATCPTYQLLGDERDSPRGRIYLMKQVMEGAQATEATQLHLDRCLTCRACETTCPSGVEYGKLVDIGREIVEQQVPRPAGQGLQRWLLRKLLPRRTLFGAALRGGQLLRPLLPAALKDKVPARRPAPAWPRQRHHRRVLMLEGCVQPALSPPINPATARLLDQLGVEVIRTPGSVCCGAVSQHLGAPGEAANIVRRTLDAWWPHVERGVEAIIVNASGCGVQVKDYGHLLRDDPDYAEKAARVSALTRDPVEFFEDRAEELAPADDAPRRIAFQAPCTLQHGQQLSGRVEALLAKIGFELTSVPDAHLCCGSAGTYSVLQPKLSKQLRDNKLAALGSGAPELIATANIGCLTHLDAASELPVRHWLELISARRQ